MLIYIGSIMWYFINAKGDENMEKPFSFYLVTDTLTARLSQPVRLMKKEA